MRRRLILVATLILAVGAGIVGSSVFEEAQPFGFNDSNSESARAYELLEDATGEQPVPGALVLVEPDQSPRSPEGQAAVARVARRLSGTRGIARAIQPDPDGSLISDDGEVALVQGILGESVDDLPEVGERVEARFAGRDDVEVGGIAVAAHQLNETTEYDLRRIELYAAPLLLLISFFVFRGLVAAMLPLLVGGLSIVFTLAGLRLLSEVMVVDVFALNVITVLGFGLAIDYSLFMVSRYREELARSGPGSAPLRQTLVPVGRMICFSAATVAAAVAALAVFPQPFLYSTGVGCALVAIASALVVLTVLPAVLALLGERVNALSPAALQHPVTRSLFWRRVARLVLARPLPIAALIAALMLAAGLPFMRAELTRADARVLTEDHSARVVDRILRERFRVDPSATMLVVLPGNGGTGDEAAAAARRLRLVGGITTVSRRTVEGLGVTLAEIAPQPYGDRAVELVEEARGMDWGGEALVTGTTAELVDQRESLGDHLPLAVAIILATTVIAVVAMTGSLLLPLLALLANALTVSVCFGILVLVFQDQRFESVLDYSGVGALDTSVPILLFAVIFGLSTDYGVFLISRVAEARQRGGSDSEALAIGMERTGRTITAAALLFAVAMGAFVFSEMIFIKEVAVGVAAAVMIDATLVRTLLLPALMRLGGRWTWWAPGPLRGSSRIRA